MRPRFALLTLFVSLAGCTDTLAAVPGHLELFIETDAPLGDRPDSVDPLFDTVRVELYRGDESPLCSQCARDFPLSRELASPSITVTTGAIVAHVCVFRARLGCIPESSLEAWAQLPDAPASGGTATTVSLLLSSLGTPSGARHAPVPSRLGRPRALPRWNGADAVPCAGAPRTDEACIPGGAFWMGNPNGKDARALRKLAVMSPFFLDKTEVSVASYRRVLGTDPGGVGHFSGRERGNNLQDHCTFTPEEGPNEDLPINCISWEAARAYCTRIGRDLPTEAQYEFAAAGQRGRLFVWGDDLPSCDDAAWGRKDAELDAIVGTGANKCARPDSRGLPLSTMRASAGRDSLRTSAGDVRDLAGNVSEWMLDGFQGANGSCWSDRGVVKDPRCDEPEDDGFGPARSTRGGAWFLGISSLASSRRSSKISVGFSIDTGFRCARRGR